MRSNALIDEMNKLLNAVAVAVDGGIQKLLVLGSGGKG